MNHKDLFSAHAQSYAQYRPSYPPALFQYLAETCKKHECAWDCATGNGQAALALTASFKKVIATDLSPEQLDQAVKHPQITYRQATAEQSTLDDHSVSLVTVAQALHWFKLEAFFREVTRVLEPQGVLAVWSYALNSVAPEIDRIMLAYYNGTIGPYWEPERALVEEGYASVQLPPRFEELKVPTFHMEQTWNLQQYLGYLRTWSATRKAMKVLGHDPLDAHLEEWAKAWGPADAKRVVRFPLAVRVAVYAG